MPSRSQRKVIGRLTQPEYALLRTPTRDGPVDAATLEASINQAVGDRFEIARGLIRAAKVLAENGDPFVKRSAVSRAYYGAYQAARATVFAIERRDEDDHQRLPAVIDSVLGGPPSAGDTLKELRRLRNEMDYSPYPGPDPESQYDVLEIENEITRSIQRAEALINGLEEHLQNRR